MRAPRASVALACAGALAAACAASGCGSATTASIDPIARAAEVTTHAGGAQLTMSAQMSLAGKQVSLSAHGDLDLKHQEGEVFTDISGLSELSGGKVPDGSTITELFTGGSLYLGSPLLDSVLPSSAHWMKIDLGKAESQLGVDPQSLTSGETDPAQYLQFLRASGGAVRKLGPATVRGTATTRYSATIEPAKVISVLAKGNAEVESKLRGAFAETGLSAIPVQVWVDSKQRLRRMQMQMSMSVSGQSVQITIEEELFDFGAIPAVSAPQAGEVYEPSLPSLGG